MGGECRERQKRGLTVLGRLGVREEVERGGSWRTEEREEGEGEASGRGERGAGRRAYSMSS